jgi:iron complex transport system permease protein
MLLTGWCVVAVCVLALVIAVGVSVGELPIPLQNRRVCNTAALIS